MSSNRRPTSHRTLDRANAIQMLTALTQTNSGRRRKRPAPSKAFRLMSTSSSSSGRNTKRSRQARDFDRNETNGVYDDIKNDDENEDQDVYVDDEQEEEEGGMPRHLELKCATESGDIGEQIARVMLLGQRAGLTVNTDKGQPVIWGDVRKNLTWTTENIPEKYIGWIQEAFQSWEDVCDVTFARKASNGFMTIRWATPQEEAANQGVIASAFFPGEALREIKLFRVFKTYGNSVGVLRHEIGHALGFRHEHIWVRMTSEDTQDAQLITEYDQHSIMHYQQLYNDTDSGVVSDLSPVDKIGAKLMYGAPASQVNFLL